MAPARKPLVTGLERFLSKDVKKLRGKRVALLANQATVTRSLQHGVDALKASLGESLVLLFGPEHGFRGELQDMEAVGDALDSATGIPVKSLYGCKEETLKPDVNDLRDIDVLIVDLPDIGARYYTYAQTLAYCMEVAAKADCHIMVLDRPNPISGSVIEGSPLLSGFRSFCGYAPVPQRHGLTLGELAFLMQEGFGEGEDAIPAIECSLEVIPCENWSREMYFDDSEQQWVYPSPNMPTLETAVIYPGSCLFEGTEISEGRGTTKPLQLFGAPYIDGSAWAAAVSDISIDLEGAILRPISFVPKFQKFANQLCGGVELHVTDRETFKPIRWSLALIYAAKQSYPKEFQWRKLAYEFLDHVPAIDLLYGSAKFRELADAGAPLKDLMPELESCEKSFALKRKPFLLY